jgi:alkanesulfonate monooxygenase SsuD/methylene tetrahydromethanopterin reductase-like flavin-dependent oxidoreductase (luciferase family)
MRRSIVLATEAYAGLPEVTVAAEQAGFHRVWTTEYTNRDALVRAIALGLASERIGVATGIAYLFTRAPLAAAASAADAFLVTGGRFALGLGTGTRGMRSRWYGVDEFDHPAARLEEYVGLMRAAWRAEDGLEFRGRFYRARVPGLALGAEGPSLDGLHVYGSGVNRTMLRIAARACDGVALHPLAAARAYLSETVVPALEEAAGERPEPLRLACWCIASIDSDEEVARSNAKRSLAFYFSTPSYASVAAGASWAAAVPAIQAAFRDGQPSPDWDDLARLVPEEMVDELTVSGTPEGVRERLPRLEAELAEHGAEEVVFQTIGVGLTPEQTVENCAQIVDACAPAERGVR